ncbi:RING-H2 finger protein ATL47 [Selaginella moellendorffii]|nr:RING-H2 finger protein ATL47 [Selaginella moellendorffii]|eukprot:XP_024539626.1 RING-H2 finger protein ATL47 [Selaginella moellendorffii]
MARLMKLVTGETSLYASITHTQAESPAVTLTYGGYMPLTRATSTGAVSSSESNGLNIVAAILVTASSMMILLALRLWLCKCSPSRSSSPNPSSSTSSDGSKKKAGDGLDKEDINKFALVDFQALASSKYEKTCTVCLCEFTSKDVAIRLLPGCNHSFHPACIEMWLFSHTSCPICRKSLLPLAMVAKSSSSSTQDHAQEEHHRGEEVV